MIEIKSFRAADGGSVILCEIHVNKDGKIEKQRYSLLPEQYKELKLAKGEISEQALTAIAEADELCRAFRSGRASLAYSANSAAALKRKLRSKGFSLDTAEAAVDMLEAQDAITEEEDACREVEKCLKKGWGKNRIVSHLYEKGYRRESMESALERLDIIDFSIICRSAIHKKWGTLPKNTAEDPNARHRAVAALMRLGFSTSDINQAIKYI